MTYPFAGTIQTKLTQDENGNPVIAWKEVDMTKETGDLGLGLGKESAFVGNTGTTYTRDETNVSYMYTLPPKEHVQLRLYKPPPVIGYWVLPGSAEAAPRKFAMFEKPNRFHRMMVKLALGWIWEDVK